MESPSINELGSTSISFIPKFNPSMNLFNTKPILSEIKGIGDVINSNIPKIKITTADGITSKLDNMK